MASPVGEAAETEIITIIVKWSGKEYPIDTVSLRNTVGHLKLAVEAKTGVLARRQKLLGLKYKAKPPADDVPLNQLNLKPNCKIMMMGTREEALEEVINPSTDWGNNVVNDLEVEEEEEIAIENREIYLKKIKRRVAEYSVEEINPFRNGKKLLVLDIDYTLFDHRSVADHPLQLMRPYLHQFLTAAYEDYDIVIWSATNMKWVQLKMKELGVLENSNYKIAFLLDNLAMISIQTEKRGVIDVKPLGVIWGKYPRYHKGNTIMFDDVRSNFLMNPQSGLRIRPFREAHKNQQTDKELLKLKKYLKRIAKLDDFTELNHRRWER
ncbi:uncharacterized protein TRIADDRAFT_51063 [Trichoplax adhaerens]|uniref:Ubiquitin-like domain-containing CTD phosphatase 1 n=1 Tax=Trichoplax adhaerens TaxID=10228 RepID=B3SB44_TRIAD|nr:hypothetical protein TRIADDRAFT_51063 [Trichoplax adhaerens]EDV20099.1 hypothetical protein TRIADDRAFT_51063 [Trichoplax adhaerens]|eukprot:XP_002117483.1 hypothetical protein TRIADDRAFT_51063 [Trichoplax adhaerens]